MDITQDDDMIAIVDYGMGNLRSISNAFEALGENVTITQKPSDLFKAKAIVVPGVGAFGDGMANLQASGFVKVLNEEVLVKCKPFLGVCLGMQFLGEQGLEHGTHKGLGWIKGTVRKIEPKDEKTKVPHIGWNDVNLVKSSVIFEGLGQHPSFYFVHSYFLDVQEKDVISSTCWHGEPIVSSVQKYNIFGVQFHPEKSQKAGLKLLKNFIDFVKSDLHA